MRKVLVTLIMAIGIVAASSLLLWAAGDAKAGKEVYTKKCASCHGAEGEGKDAVAKMLKVEIKHLGSKEVQAKSDADLAKMSKDGTGKMKAVSGLTDKDTENAVAYLRTLAKK
jgi:mono/diheme cytochrome c family protein